MRKTACIILAAGRGTRMRSSLPKVLHRIAGRTMIEYLLGLVRPLGFKPVVVVVGFGGDEVARCAAGCEIVRQKKLLGSADAVMTAQKKLAGFRKDTLVLYGDTPLIKQETIHRLVAGHDEKEAACTVLTAKLKNPSGYGRVVRRPDGSIAKIIEENDASLADKGICEINVGAYCFDNKLLFDALKEVRINDKKKEYYLTDIVEILDRQGHRVESVPVESEEEALGINSRQDLAVAQKVVRDRTIRSLMSEGVTFEDPQNTYVGPGCLIGPDTVIRPFTFIDGDVKIGAGCVIGPFARLRPGTVLHDGVEIGNFAEVSRSVIGSGSKVRHHSYIGDAVIGKNVNIGAGAITANYDGKNKNKTVIKDGSFIGSGTIFVAPVTVGRKAVTGAGSVLTKNTKVPDNAVVVGVPARLLKKAVSG